MEQHPIVIGLGYGDEAKGSIVDFLCSETPTDYVIRFSGGPQAAHNVVLDDGTEHTFAQFGSGTFQGAKTILSEYMLVNPFNMVVEANSIEHKTGIDPFPQTYISDNSLIITPIHVAANRQREINRGANAHGSCGLGIGETRGYALSKESPGKTLMTMGQMNESWSPFSSSTFRHELLAYQRHCEKNIDGFHYDGDIDELIENYRQLMLDKKLNIVPDQWIYQQIKHWGNYNVFEGSQGILLDESFGFHPHTTWSAVSDRNARQLVQRAGVSQERFKTIGVTRTYGTRHGAGPFPAEFEADYDWTVKYPEMHNAWGRFQGGWRAGLLDVPLLEYAVQVNGGVDEIALTHCDSPVDRIVEAWPEPIIPVTQKDLTYQESLTHRLSTYTLNDANMRTVDSTDDIATILETRLHAPVAIKSYGKTATDKTR